MKRTLRLCGLVMTVLLVCSRPAEAGFGWWDWLEDLSGPGPYRSGGNLMVTLFCTESEPNTLTGRFFQVAPTPKAEGTCFFFDQRWFEAKENDRFFPVRVSIREFGPSARLHAAVELGGGIGRINFRSGDHNEGRWTITFPRLVFMPLMTIPRLQKNNDWGFLKIYMRETLIAGDLTQDDFAAKPGTEFSARHERVKSMGFIIDVSAFLHLVGILHQ